MIIFKEEVVKLEHVCDGNDRYYTDGSKNKFKFNLDGDLTVLSNVEKVVGLTKLDVDITSNEGFKDVYVEDGGTITTFDFAVGTFDIMGKKKVIQTEDYYNKYYICKP